MTDIKNFSVHVEQSDIDYLEYRLIDDKGNEIFDKERLQVISNRVNQHDKLVEENQRLRKALEDYMFTMIAKHPDYRSGKGTTENTVQVIRDEIDQIAKG